MSSANSGQLQAGRFQKGQSGNPAGKPRGVRNASTMAAEVLLAGEAEALTRKCIELAMAGDVIALKLCLERVYPAPRKDRLVSFELPKITNPRDAADIMAAVAEAVAAGTITPGEAAEYAKVVDAYVRAYQTAELDDRVARVEQMSDAELMRIATGRRDEPERRASKLLILNQR